MPRKGQTGIVVSDETRRRISMAVRKAYAERRLVHWKTGRHDLPGPFTGKKHSEDTKERISISRKGKCLGNTQGFVAGMTPHNKGKSHNVHTPEWRKKVSEANSGPNHWNWKGGISSESRRMRNSTLHKEWSSEVLKRDRWTCTSCGYKGRLLIAHHIVPWKSDHSLRFSVSNGITLCRSCHCELHKPRTGTGKSPKPR